MENTKIAGVAFVNNGSFIANMDTQPIMTGIDARMVHVQILNSWHSPKIWGGVSSISSTSTHVQMQSHKPRNVTCRHGQRQLYVFLFFAFFTGTGCMVWNTFQSISFSPCACVWICHAVRGRFMALREVNGIMGKGKWKRFGGHGGSTGGKGGKNGKNQSRKDGSWQATQGGGRTHVLRWWFSRQPIFIPKTFDMHKYSPFRIPNRMDPIQNRCFDRGIWYWNILGGRERALFFSFLTNFTWCYRCLALNACMFSWR